MRLTDGKVGESYFVKEINLKIPIKRRLEVLGMTTNARVDILNSKRTNTKIIKVRGTRFAIGKSFADGIEVCPAPCIKEEDAR